MRKIVQTVYTQQALSAYRVNVKVMLGQRRRRCTRITSTLTQHVVFAGRRNWNMILCRTFMNILD